MFLCSEHVQGKAALINLEVYLLMDVRYQITFDTKLWSWPHRGFAPALFREGYAYPMAVFQKFWIDIRKPVASGRVWSVVASLELLPLTWKDVSKSTRRRIPKCSATRYVIGESVLFLYTALRNFIEVGLWFMKVSRGPVLWFRNWTEFKSPIYLAQDFKNCRFSQWKPA